VDRRSTGIRMHGKDGRARERPSGLTHWEVTETFQTRGGNPIASLLTCQLETDAPISPGASRHIGHPLMGDAVYGPAFLPQGQMRSGREPSAWWPRSDAGAPRYLLTIEAPGTGEILNWQAALPEDLLLLQTALQAAE